MWNCLSQIKCYENEYKLYCNVVTRRKELAATLQNLQLLHLGVL
jgi:hypothetical protein